MERLINLFENPKSWIIELENRSKYNNPIKDSNDQYHYIYCWVNLDTQWCYVGKHSSYNAYNEENYQGSCGNPHYWNSLKLHEFKCIILSYSESNKLLSLLESLVIDTNIINKYSEKGLYNLNPGGDGSWYSGRLKLRELYPDTNGASPSWSESGRKRMKELFPETNGMPPQCLEAKRLLFPKTNGAPDNFIKAGQEVCHIARKIKYSEYNGFTRECIEKGAAASIKSRKELWPETNGAPPQWINSIKARRISRILNNITKKILELHDKNLECNLNNYLSLPGAYGNYTRTCDLLEDYPEVINDSRWTSEMTEIFKNVINK